MYIYNTLLSWYAIASHDISAETIAALRIVGAYLVVGNALFMYWSVQRQRCLVVVRVGKTLLHGLAFRSFAAGFVAKAKFSQFLTVRMLGLTFHLTPRDGGLTG
jgi:hypothetical protein